VFVSTTTRALEVQLKSNQDAVRSRNGLRGEPVALFIVCFLISAVLVSRTAPAQSLYVASQGDSGNGTSIPAILRFNLATAAFESVFVNGNLPIGIAFGPDGDLFVAEFANGNISRYDGTTGAFKTKISGSELKNPLAIITGPG
jgi:hypothetical protein